jgi:hypothetical protein
MATNQDFKDLFAALSAQDSEFIVVGAHAVMVHTEPRYTKDLDVWISRPLGMPNACMLLSVTLVRRSRASRPTTCRLLVSSFRSASNQTASTSNGHRRGNVRRSVEPSRALDLRRRSDCAPCH